MLVTRVLPLVQLGASQNANPTLFYYLKKLFHYYAMLFYNISNIPKFYFHILLIKIIYLRNKKKNIYIYIYIFFFSNFILHLPSTSITAPLPSHHHRASTMPTMPPLPTTHQNPTRTKTHIKKKKKKTKKTHSVTHADQNTEPRPRRPSTTQQPMVKHNNPPSTIQTFVKPIGAISSKPNPPIHTDPNPPSTNPNPPPCPDQTTNPT